MIPYASVTVCAKFDCNWTIPLSEREKKKEGLFPIFEVTSGSMRSLPVLCCRHDLLFVSMRVYTKVDGNRTISLHGGAKKV